MLSITSPSIIALGTQYCYAECHLSCMSFMLSVTNKSLMLSVVMLNVIMLSVIMLNVVPPCFASDQTFQSIRIFAKNGRTLRLKKSH
jgi:hypothetical protein